MRDPKSVLDNLETIKASERNVILFGSVGVGKTTLLNKIKINILFILLKI